MFPKIMLLISTFPTQLFPLLTSVGLEVGVGVGIGFLVGVEVGAEVRVGVEVGVLMLVVISNEVDVAVFFVVVVGEIFVCV